MSTFDGKIEEIPGIFVDEFEDSSGKCYFLSHCHTDHMRGLAELQTEACVYTTSISALLLRRKCPQLEENIRILEIGVPTAIEVSQDDEMVNFVVTAISAGHCPGSCMLLFQIEGCDVLYTGDFRISLKDAQNVKLLKEIRSNSPIVYLDSTFLSSKFPSFPTQTESVKLILKIVEDFLGQSMNHKGEWRRFDDVTVTNRSFLVNLVVPARYGYEYLLMELSSKLSEKIFIHENDVFDQYSAISRLNACVTTNERKARIFLKPTFVTSTLKFDDQDEVLSLQLSAMFWANWKRGAPFSLETKKNSYRVCYATHNSLAEIRDFLTFLQPRKVHLNVVPESVEQKKEMLKQLKSIQDSYSEKETQAAEPKKKFSFKRIRSMSSRKEAGSLAAEKKIRTS
jgi:hypothetical protein